MLRHTASNQTIDLVSNQISSRYQKYKPYYLDNLSWQLIAKLEIFDQTTLTHSFQTAQFVEDFIYSNIFLPNSNSIKLSDALTAANISPDQVLRAAVLHDIGKINLAKEIITQNDALTHEERKIMEKHETETEEILMSLGFKTEALIAGQHHNYAQHQSRLHFHLPGYGFRISVADIIKLADVKEALTSNDRPYRKATSKIRALSFAINEAEEKKIGEEITYFWAIEELKKIPMLNPEDRNVFGNIRNFIIKQEQKFLL